MSAPVRVLLVFCEGYHDSVFIEMVLRQMLGYSREQQLRFSAMPSPFNALFSESVQQHAGGDLSLSMAHKFYLPDTMLKKDGGVAFVFRVDGKYGEPAIVRFLLDFLPLLGEAEKFPSGASQVAQPVHYLFSYDADTDGVDKVAKEVAHRLHTIGDDDFIAAPWAASASEFGRVSGDKAVFVWGETPQKGTLEDVLMPLFERGDSASIFDTLKGTMKDLFAWDLNSKRATTAMAESSAYKKAVITAAGQRQKPGSSLHVILQQAGLLTEADLQSCPIALEFTKFLKDFWQ